jgi:O-antigen/teichoic acid export membrane protein
MGMDALGNYGYALALASVLLIVPDFGLHLFAVRELSSSPQQLPEVFWNVHWLKFALTVAVTAFAMCFGAWGISRSRATRRVLHFGAPSSAAELLACRNGCVQSS